MRASVCLFERANGFYPTHLACSGGRPHVLAGVQVEVVRRHRCRVKMPLKCITTALKSHRFLKFGFNSFCDHFKTKEVRQSNCCPNEGNILLSQLG